MPYVDLHSDDDYASIFYTTNSPFGNVGGFDGAKATVIMLHPFFLDSTWLENQFGDPRLHQSYNLIAFDLRICGRSSARPTARHDAWVDAADLALCHMKLQLPKCHIIAHDSISVNCAMRFAFLFPEMCASLTLCNIPPPSELSWVFGAWEEVIEQWCFPADLDTFEIAGKESLRFMIGADCEPDLLDDLIAYWQMNYPPRRRQRILELSNVSLHRQSMTNEMFREIRVPVLIMHGDHNDTCPIKYAEELRSRLSNVPGDGAVLYTLKGAAGSLSTFQGNASIVVQVFTKFLKQQPLVPSVPLPDVDIHERMAEALQRLGDYYDAKDWTYSSRDPMSSLSFCVLPQEVFLKQDQQLKAYGKDLASAFSALRPNGRPIRKFSERKDEHWFSSGKDGISYAGATTHSFGSLGTFGHSSKQNPEPAEKPLPFPQSEPMTEVVQHGRLRRGTIGPNSVEKGVIKGSMAKVVSSNTSNSIGRLLK
ncbi:alpha/beta-hydrolase [Hymenopellis radicata]|nr:alpha/beta-hydrolase [Hymenopellis radicata]